MLGVFGFILSVVQIAALERQELATMDWAETDNILYVGLVVVMTDRRRAACKQVCVRASVRPCVRACIVHRAQLSFSTTTGCCTAARRSREPPEACALRACVFPFVHPSRALARAYALLAFCMEHTITHT